MSFGETLRQLRKQKNLSQEKIANLLGVSRQSVSKWENGLSHPDTNNLIRLAEILSVSLDELTGNASVNQPTKKLEENYRVTISKFAIITYLVSFSSIIGFFCPPSTNVPMPNEIWMGVSIIGGCLLVIKNCKLVRYPQLLKVLFMDMGMVLLGCLMGGILPNKIGLVKPIVIAIPLAIYMGWVLRKYFSNENN